MHTRPGPSISINQTFKGPLETLFPYVSLVTRFSAKASITCIYQRPLLAEGPQPKSARRALGTLILGQWQMCKVGNEERLYFGDVLRCFFGSIHFSDAHMTLRRSSFQK